MAKVKLDIGATVDFLNKGELEDSLDKYRHQADAAKQAEVRGIKYFRVPTMIGSQTSGTITIGTSGSNIQAGPREGYAWSIKRVFVNGLGTSDVINMYRNDPLPSSAVWQFTGSNPMQKFGKLDIVVLGGETIQFQSVGSFSSTQQIFVNADAIEVPYEMIGKLA